MLNSSPSSIASDSDAEQELQDAASLLANDGASMPLLLPPPRRASPRLSNILESLECPFHEGILSVHDAASMPVGTLGELTETVRDVSLEVLMLAPHPPGAGSILPPLLPSFPLLQWHLLLWQLLLLRLCLRLFRLSLCLRGLLARRLHLRRLPRFAARMLRTCLVRRLQLQPRWTCCWL